MCYTKFVPPVLEQISSACQDATSAGIARTIATLIRRDELHGGARLPTVRALAAQLSVSPSTVSEAWRILGRHGLVSTARRNGTVVTATREMSGRFWKVPANDADIVDLSTGTPDTAFLPSIQSTLQALPDNITISSYIDRPVLEELDAVLCARWPFTPEAMTVVDGALDAIDRLITSLVGFGDHVVVEDPTFPPILDMLERSGAQVIGVGLDDAGMRPIELRDALERHPVLVIVQPLAHNPTGRSMTPGRVAELAEVLQASSADPWIIEDHHAGDLIERPEVSIGRFLPERVVRVHSFSKSHGPDLRIAAVGGAADPIEAVVDRRRLGPSWTSRLVQHMLLALLLDDAIRGLIGSAVDEYTTRRATLSRHLAEAGVDVTDGEGLNLWIPVLDEGRAMVALALRGIGVAPGTPFAVAPGSSSHIRVSVGNARGDLTDLAAAIATATQA